MRVLSRDARNLLDAARAADRAPTAARHRARERFLGAVTAGTLTTSALVAKGAALGTLGNAAGAAATAGATTTVATTLIGSVMVGICTGLLVLAPASDVSGVSPGAIHEPARAVHSERPSVPHASAVAAPNDPAVSNPSVPQAPRSDETALETRARTVPSVGNGPTYIPLQDEPSSAEGFGPAASTGGAPLPSVSVPPMPTKASIAVETEMLADVQRALQQGRPASAIAKLNQYDRAFPQGALREEATASRVVALCAFGRKADAQRWSVEFFRRYPNSPLSARVHGACSATGQPAPGDRGSPP